MVKNKARPDSAAHPKSGLSVSLSLRRRSSSGYPWILPSEAGPWQSTIFASVSSIEICLLFVPLLESVYFTPVDLRTLNFKSMRQDLKLRNLALFYTWEGARVRVH